MSKRRALEASKCAPAKSGVAPRADVHGSRPGDVAGALESSLFESLGELRLSAQLLALQVACVQALVMSTLAAHSKDSNRLLCEVMSAEATIREMKRRAKKGAKRGSP